MSSGTVGRSPAVWCCSARRTLLRGADFAVVGLVSGVTTLLALPAGVWLARVTFDGYGAVSAMWNAAYDIGMTIDALGVGLLVGLTGYLSLLYKTGR